MSDFGADTCDFHSDFASDFRTESDDYASDFRDFPGDFSGDFGGAPRPHQNGGTTPTAQTNLHQLHRDQPPRQGLWAAHDGGKLAAHRKAEMYGGQRHATRP